MTSIYSMPTDGKRRLSQVVANRIAHDILSSNLKPDALFGLERDLIARYMVSRATLREAIRQVERHGAARMRRGGGGGLLVADTAKGAAARILTAYLEFSDITLAEQFDARIILETLAARLAAERADEATVGQLRELVGKVKGEKELKKAGQLHFALRSAVADATGNVTLSLFTSALHRVAADLSPILTGSPEEGAAYLKREVEHKFSLVEAIMASDAGAAQEIMRAEATYLHTRPLLAPYLGSAICDLLLEAGESPQIGSDRAPADEKLGIMTALKLRRDIAMLGWPVGRNLGPEHELCNKYQVGRGVMRESIMLLELHRIVSVRRGKLGGVEVGRPNAGYTLDNAARFLRYLHPPEDDLREISRELAINAAQALATRATSDDILALRAHGRTILGVEVPLLRGALASLHGDIHQRAGNRATSLVAEVIATYMAQTGTAPIPLEDQILVRQTHLGVVEAIAASDPSLAAHRMRRVFSLAR